jgi:hypothetical protein
MKSALLHSAISLHAKGFADDPLDRLIVAERVNARNVTPTS